MSGFSLAEIRVFACAVPNNLDRTLSIAADNPDNATDSSGKVREAKKD